MRATNFAIRQRWTEANVRMTAATSKFDRRPWLLLAPALVSIALLVLIPMCFILVYSFYENLDLAVDRPAFQFGNWIELFTDGYYRYAIWKTVRLAAIVTVLAAAMGYVPAYFIAMTRLRRNGCCFCC